MGKWRGPIKLDRGGEVGSQTSDLEVKQWKVNANKGL